MELDHAIQTMLGLPELNRTETRRNLAKIFALYRRCKLILIMQLEPDIEQMESNAVAGYENAMDPDLVRIPYRVTSGIPAGWGTRTIDHTSELRRFVRWVESKVNRLPRTKSEIIKRRFLTLDEPLPSDTEVWFSLDHDGIAYISTRKYERMKAEALMILGSAFGVEVEEKELV